MDQREVIDLDGQYRELREGAGLVTPDDRAFMSVTGSEAGEFLHSQVTNDVASLEDGEGCYSLLLDRKAHIRADMRILRIERDDFLIVCGSEAAESVTGHLEMYKIGRDVAIEDRSAELRMIALVGPRASEICGAKWRRRHDHSPVEIDGVACRAVSAAMTEIPRIDLICEAGQLDDLRAGLESRGAVPIEQSVLETLRIEAGIPKYGREMTSERMPAEVGVVADAISFDKGCYIGQEPVARMHYRGRPNRVLRRLRPSGSVEVGRALVHAGKEVGRISSSAISPASGPVALAVVRREAEPGSTLGVAESDLTVEVLAESDESST